MKLNTPILVVILLVIAGGILGYVNFYNNGENKTPQLFQPDSQILDQAVDASQAGANKGDSIPENPIKPNATPYKYDSTKCTHEGYGCLTSLYKSLTLDYGVTTASADIKKRAGENPSVLGQCHPLMHVIGRNSVDAYKTISEAFAHGDSYCWSGYYHGVMEGMIGRIGLENLAAKINDICADIPGRASYDFNYFNCVHGLGHGIMALLEDEVFDSLKVCDNLTGSWERESCYSGIFMQNIIDSTNVSDTGGVVKYLKPKEPLYPCTAVETKYKFQCYLGQTSYALQVTGYDYRKVFDLCKTVEEPYRNVCNQSMGRDVANQAGHEKNKTKAFCEMALNPNDIQNCIIGAVKEIISYYHSDKEALEYCNILAGADKDLCTSTAKSYYSNF